MTIELVYRKLEAARRETQNAYDAMIAPEALKGLSTEDAKMARTALDSALKHMEGVSFVLSGLLPASPRT